MEIHYMPDAKRDLRNVGHVAAARIMNKISAYAANPAAFANRIKKLQGEDCLRFRIGDYRVLFTEDGIILNVLRIGHRREIYR